MKKFLQKPTEKLFGIRKLDRDAVVYNILPRVGMEILRKYLRLEVEGIEHLPQKGRAIIAPNHSGYAGLDALILGHEIYKKTGRVARLLAHQLWFVSSITAGPAHKLGFVEATTNNGIRLLEHNNMIILFPEGEAGNFKPTSQRYYLQEFRRGFVRMALMSQAPIVPTLIIGAEETHINLRQLKFTKHLFGAALPLPLNIVPFPAKWKLRFLEPIVLPHKPEDVNDPDLVREISSNIQEKIQLAINKELAERSFVYF